MCPCRPALCVPSIRLPSALVVLVTVLIVSGCNSSSSSTANGGVKPPADVSGGQSAALGVKSPFVPQTPGTVPSDTSRIVSSIAGDRIQVISTSYVMTKQTESSPFRFAEIAKEAGIDFVHFSGMTEEKHFPTANGSGVAVFDYDNDGLLDIYFATATLLPLGTAQKGPNRLYKNLGGSRFRDVTDGSGLGYRGFCHGIVAGDIDNDGDVDVFLCNYGSNVLYLNNGNGTFTDISKEAGIDAPNWSSGGAMLDCDNDGYLDIYVANYGRWNIAEDNHPVGDPEKKIYLYASPRSIKTVKHLFYRNNGDRTFTNVYDRVITSEQDGDDPAGKTKTPRRPRPHPPRRRAWLRRRHGRLERRRLDRHLRRQRHEPELPVLEPRRRNF